MCFHSSVSLISIYLLSFCSFGTSYCLVSAYFSCICANVTPSLCFPGTLCVLAVIAFIAFVATVTVSDTSLYCEHLGRDCVFPGFQIWPIVEKSLNIYSNYIIPPKNVSSCDIFNFLNLTCMIHFSMRSKVKKMWILHFFQVPPGFTSVSMTNCYSLCDSKLKDISHPKPSLRCPLLQTRVMLCTFVTCCNLPTWHLVYTLHSNCF